MYTSDCSLYTDFSLFSIEISLFIANFIDNCLRKMLLVVFASLFVCFIGFVSINCKIS